MASPTPPVALSATYLAVLQSRTAAQPAQPPSGTPPRQGKDASPPGSVPAGVRGRLVDITV
jgi:hypothetical protein